jgi:UDP-N-acetylmuramoyl-tripeptide--D-alanyl-D-alanine ligase
MIDLLYPIFLKHPIVSTDSRKITEGCLFFALKGENFDGNVYAEKALTDGAAYAIIDNPSFKKNEQYIVVGDVLQTLQDLARHHRQQFDFPVIVIAGSNGKTTTKELVSAVMSSHYKAHFTKGNFNNHIGVPLTLLQLTEVHEVAIIEIGANHPQEHLDLCHITEPTHGVVTNMGKDHLEGFGGFEGVKKANAEVFEWIAAHKGMIFLNDDEPFLKEFLPKNARLIHYRNSDSPSLKNMEYEASIIAADPFLTVGMLDSKGQIQTATTKLVGEYNFANIITAIAIGKYFKVPTSKIKEALEAYTPANMRSQMLTHASGATILLDAYNANPSSMELALKTLSQMPFKRKIAIIGDMRELGEESLDEHISILNFIKTLNINQLVTVGTEFLSINTEPTFSGVAFEDSFKAKEWFATQAFDKDTCILLKGSRGIKLEVILQ